jgi:hypothetical protein
MTDANTVTDGKGTKPRQVDRFFVDKDGKSQPRAFPEAVKVIHSWKNREDLKLEMDISKLSDEMKICAIAFGISQVVGNAYGGETDPDEAFDKGESRWETILGGKWATERESGPRTGDLVEAFAKAYADKGKKVTDEWKAQVAEQINSGAIDQKEALKNPLVRAAFDAIKLRRAQERAAKSSEAAAATAELPSLGF